jgi:hypothetical protein
MGAVRVDPARPLIASVLHEAPNPESGMGAFVCFQAIFSFAKIFFGLFSHLSMRAFTNLINW